MKKLLSFLTFLSLNIFSTSSIANEEATTLGELWSKMTPHTAKQILDKGYNINKRDEEGRTAIILASWLNDDPEVIMILLQNGAKINDKDQKGMTPLMYASKLNENPEIIKILLENGADATIKDAEGKTALSYAKENPKIYKTDIYWQMNSLMTK